MIVLRDSEDETALRSTFLRFFAKYQAADPLRSASGSHRSPLWAGLAELGALDMATPAGDAGASATHSQLCVLAEAAGGNLSSVGLVEHLVASRFLGEHASNNYRLSAGATTAVALRPSRSGRWQGVLLAPETAAVVGVHGGKAGVVQLMAVPDSNYRMGPLQVCDITIDDAQFTPVSTVSGFGKALDMWRMLTAAFLVGISATALAKTVDYVGTRHQFDRPIGSYQAIQHGLADLPGMIDGTRLLTAKAAWALDNPDVVANTDVSRNDITDSCVLASMAFLFAADTATMVVDRALHYHGAIGACAEFGIHDSYRVTRSLPLLLGTASSERRHLADLLLEPTWTSR